MRLIRVFVTVLMAMILVLTTAPPAGALVDIYVIPGDHTINGRQWRTTCEPYSATKRCRTEIWGSVVKRRGGGYVVVNGWMFNNLTYAAAPYSLWQQNSLSRSFDHLTLSDGRAWRSECFTALTGRGCRGWIMASVVETYQTRSGNNAYRQVNKWVLNHMIRFDSSPIAPHFGKNSIQCEKVTGGRNILTDIVDPDNRGYSVTFLTGDEQVTVDTAPGTRTVKYFQPSRTCDEYWGGVNLG